MIEKLKMQNEKMKARVSENIGGAKLTEHVWLSIAFWLEERLAFRFLSCMKKSTNFNFQVQLNGSFLTLGDRIQVAN